LKLDKNGIYFIFVLYCKYSTGKDVILPIFTTKLLEVYMPQKFRSFLILSLIMALLLPSVSVGQSRTDYDGHLRVFVVEPVSRWENSASDPFDFAVIDFAYDENIYITESFSEVIDWDGNTVGFGDVTSDNIMVIAALYNAEGHLAYAYPPSSNPFTAHYVDAAAVATPGNPGSNQVTTEYTHTVFVEEAAATW
jgi:hypothetical protein